MAFRGEGIRTPAMDELISWLEGRLGRPMSDWERGKLAEWLRRIWLELQQ